MSNLLEKVHSHFHEGLKNAEIQKLFYNKDIWSSEDHFDIKYASFFGHHVNDYYSPLNPGFLYQQKNPALLSRFKMFMARDGLAGLNYFFIRNEKPKSKSLILLVPAELGFVVPDEWLEYCAFYQIRSVAKRREKEETLFLDGCCLPECLDLKNAKKKLNTVAEYEKYKKIYISMTFTTCFKYNKALNEDTMLFIEVMREAQKYFSENIEYVLPHKLFDLNVNNCTYLSLNSRPFWYYDSFIKYNILETGARPLNPTHFEAQEVLTFKHGLLQEIDIFQKLPDSIDQTRKYYFKQLATRPQMIVDEQRKTRNSHILEKIEMLSPDMGRLLTSCYDRLYENDS